MQTTQIHRARAEEVKEKGRVKEAIEDTLKVFYHLVDTESQQDIDELYFILSERGY